MSLDAQFKDMHQKLEAQRLRILTLEREAAHWKVKALHPKVEGEERVRMEERMAVAELLRFEAGGVWRNKADIADLLRRYAMVVETGKELP